MRDSLSEPPSTKMLQPQDGFPSTPGGFYEDRQTEEMSLGLILASLRKYWYVSIIISTLMMAGIVYKTQKEPRIYKSSIQIAIELKERSSLGDKLAATTGGGSSDVSDNRTTTMETIIQILRSRKIVQKSLDNIPDLKLKPSADAVLSQLTIQPGQNSNILTISYTDTSPNRIVAILTALSKSYINYSITTKKARTDNSIAFIEKELPKSRHRLEISSKQLQAFREKYRFVDPESSAGDLTSYRQEILVKLNEVKAQYNQSKNQSRELTQQLKTVGLKSDNVLSTTMLTQDSAYQELFKKLNELELAYNQAQVRFSNENPLVISAKEKRDSVLVLLKNRAQQMLKRNVPTQELTNGGIANFGNSLAQNLANKQAELQTSLAAQTAQYESLSQVYQQVESQISQLPALQKQYTELQRQYTINSQELTAFLQKLQGLKISDAEEVVPWSLLDAPELPLSPISPDVPRQLGLGAIGSLLVGTIAAVGLKKLDSRIDSPDTIKSMTGMPILSLVPYVENFDLRSNESKGFFGQRSDKKSKNYSYWSFIEAVRTLALGIGLTCDKSDDNTGRSIAMTSSQPKEGKSTLTFYTSITLAELGYRVLLVDVDLHKSTIARLCRRSELFQSVDCAGEAGLSDALLHGDKWQDLIKRSPQLDLDILFSGPQSFNSIALLNSVRFKRMIEEWKQEYDYVIFDTPPVIGVSDTRLIGTLVDGLIYVVSLDVAQKQTINRALDIISSMKTPVLGVVVNRVENKHSGYSKYHEYYYAKDNYLAEEIPEAKLIDREYQDVKF